MPQFPGSVTDRCLFGNPLLAINADEKRNRVIDVLYPGCGFYVSHFVVCYRFYF